jgi:CheY-like chemotaxis protein
MNMNNKNSVKRNNSRNSGKTILVVEDNDSLSKLIQLKLEESGYQVLSAMNGEDALKMVKRSVPDLVWLDIYLPGMNGLELLKRLRGDAKTKDVKVAIVSVSGSNKKVEVAEGLSIEGFFVKSNYKLDELIEQVDKILKK